MLYWKKWMLLSAFSIMIPAFFLSVSVLYSQNACAEEWKPCTQKYTIMDALTEIMFAKNGTDENKKEEVPPQYAPELPSSTSPCQTSKSTNRISPPYDFQYRYYKITD